MRLYLYVGYANAQGRHEKGGINFDWCLEEVEEVATISKRLFKQWYGSMRSRAKMKSKFIGVIDTRVEVVR